MTLIDEVRNPSSSLSMFLRQRLAGRDSIAGRWREQLRLSAPVPAPASLDPSDRPRLGVAFETRLGLDLADEAPYRDVLAMVPPEEAMRILAAAELRRTGVEAPAAEEPSGWGRRDDWDPLTADGQLHQDAWNLSEFGGLLRKTGRPDRQQWRGLYRLMQQEVWPNAFPDGVAEAMATLWRAYLGGGRQELLTLGLPRMTQPVFDDAFAVGDLVLGDCLVDIKVYADPAPALPEFLDQLLGYVLSDTDDLFGIRSVGVYLGWHAGLLTAELHEVVPCESQDLPQALTALRSDFQAVVRPEAERARFYKHGTIPG